MLRNRVGVEVRVAASHAVLVTDGDAVAQPPSIAAGVRVGVYGDAKGEGVRRKVATGEANTMVYGCEPVCSTCKWRSNNDRPPAAVLAHANDGGPVSECVTTIGMPQLEKGRRAGASSSVTIGSSAALPALSLLCSALAAEECATLDGSAPRTSGTWY